MDTNLLVGIFIGAVIMWGIDYLFYGRQSRTGNAELTRLRQTVSDLEETVTAETAARQSAETKLAATSEELVTARADAKQAVLQREEGAEETHRLQESLKLATAEIEKLEEDLNKRSEMAIERADFEQQLIAAQEEVAALRVELAAREDE